MPKHTAKGQIDVRIDECSHFAAENMSAATEQEVRNQREGGTYHNQNIYWHQAEGWMRQMEQWLITEGKMS